MNIGYVVGTSLTKIKEKFPVKFCDHCGAKCEYGSAYTFVYADEQRSFCGLCIKLKKHKLSWNI